MAQIKVLPPTAYLQVCFAYNPKTGELFWRERPREHFGDKRSYMRWNTCYANTCAGSPTTSGHRTVLINKTAYQTHRIIWKLMTNEEPPETIDHIDRDPLNNKWLNLRAATKFQQVGNQHLHSTNTSGYRGVSPHSGGKWIAILAKRYLGLFNTPEEASEAYEKAAREYFGEFYTSIDRSS